MEQDIGNRLLKFADDTKLFGVVSSGKEVDGLREDLRKLCDWSAEWLMMFNTDKCKVMHFGKSNSLSVYSMNGANLSVINEEKDLGIIVQDTLKVSAQCAKVVKSANKVLGMIKRTFVSREPDIIVNLYKAFVRPHLEYCIQAWRPHLKKDIDLLEGVQRRATKLINGFSDITYQQRLAKLKLTTLETRRLREDTIEVYKILKGFDNVEYKDLFQLSTTNLRGHGYKLFKARVNTDIGKYSFCNRVIE